MWQQQPDFYLYWKDAAKDSQCDVADQYKSGHNSEDSWKDVENTTIERFQATRIKPNEFKLLSLALLPVVVYILGQILFDIIGVSFAGYAMQLLSSSANIDFAESAIAAAQLWGSASLIYLVVSIGLIGYVFRFLGKNVKGKALYPFWGIASFLIVIGVSHLLWVDESRRPLSMIFYLTFESLKASSLMQSNSLDSIDKLLDVINVLSVVIPSLFCAFMPSVLITPRGGWTDDMLVSRIKSGRKFCACSSVFLVVGILHMFAWMRLSFLVLGRPELSQLASGIVFYWAFVFSTMIATLYACILLTLDGHRESLEASRESSSAAGPHLLSELGIAFDGKALVKQVVIVFAPVISALAVTTTEVLLESGI